MLSQQLVKHTANRFAPISLDDLVSQAALMTRTDRKYILHATAAKQVLNSLPTDTLVLEQHARRGFNYRSVYFDTREHVSYMLNATKRRRRFKVRTREYVESKLAFLEVKTKNGRGQTVKERVHISPETSDFLTASGQEYVDNIFNRLGHKELHASNLQPTMTNTYNRFTFLTGDGSRLTVDTDLAWAQGVNTAPKAHDTPGNYQFRLPETVIIETKSAGAPSPADKLLWQAGHRPQRVSKFAAGVATLYPYLPNNKWHRVLTREFNHQKIVL